MNIKPCMIADVIDDLLLVVHPSEHRRAHSVHVFHRHALVTKAFSVCFDEVADTFQSAAAFDVQSSSEEIIVRSEGKQLAVIEKGRAIPGFLSEILLWTDKQLRGFGADVEDSAKI